MEVVDLFLREFDNRIVGVVVKNVHILEGKRVVNTPEFGDLLTANAFHVKCFNEFRLEKEAFIDKVFGELRVESRKLLLRIHVCALFRKNIACGV